MSDSPESKDSNEMAMSKEPRDAGAGKEVAALAPPAAPPPRAGRALWPYVFALGFLLLGAGQGYLWFNAQAHQADATQLAVLRAQMEDLRAAQAQMLAQASTAPESVTVQADLAQKYLALAAQLGAVQAQAASDHGALTAMQANTQDVGKLTQRMTLLNALGSARLALDAGQRLGVIPGAPAALAQFASLTPPTEAGLRESFGAAAKLAEEASLSADGRLGFWARVKLRFEGLITISNGTHVLFGPPAAASLAQAQAALDDGDLAGAVAAVQGLNAGALAAMAPWLAQAQALLAARAALVAMAQGA